MGRKAIDPNDIIGKRFGKLVVKEYQGRPDYKYLCQCDCGKETSVYRYDLLSSKTKSCGCLSKASKIDPQDIVGKRFGHWTVLEYLGKDRSYEHFYMAKCDCGTVQRLRRSNLISGAATSCGCVRGYKSRTLKPVELAKEIHKLVGRQIGPYYVAQGAGLSSIDKKTVLYLCLDQNGNEVILREERLLAV